MFFEAFNNILRPWVSIIANSNQCFPEETCKYASTQIFNTYLKCHISPPNGTRTNVEFTDNEEDDRAVNKEQLQYIGIFGRLVSKSSRHFLKIYLFGYNFVAYKRKRFDRGFTKMIIILLLFSTYYTL